MAKVVRDKPKFCCGQLDAVSEYCVYTLGMALHDTGSYRQTHFLVFGDSLQLNCFLRYFCYTSHMWIMYYHDVPTICYGK
jgi:hypothetical protein